MDFSCPFIFYIPQETFIGTTLLYYPVEALHFNNVVQETEQYATGPKEKSEDFLKKFEEELRKTSIKYLKKVWTEEEDKYLLELAKKKLKWTEISKQILGSNPQICKRRYIRLKQDETKWPKQVEKQIKRVCSRVDIRWEQKIKILYYKFPNIRGYSNKMIKQRYLTYLEEGIEQKPWTIEEDMALIRMIQNGIKRWKTITQALPGRTKLHLKNRYYGCLRAIQQKVQKQLLENQQR